MIVATSCDDGRPPASPTRPFVDSTPFSGLPPAVIAYEVEGPDRIAPGETATLRLSERLTDGTIRDYAAGDAWWGISQGQCGPCPESGELAVVEQNGEVTGLAAGEVTVSVGREFPPFETSHSLLILPAGTYRVTGTVREADVGDPIVGASVEVRSARRPAVFSDADGGFVLYGVASEAELRISKRGYRERRERLRLSDHHAIDVALALESPRPDMSGTYTLTLAVADECAGRFPADARTRRYNAVVRQQGARVEVSLSGARFVGFPDAPESTPDRLEGRVEADRIAFDIPALVEDLGDGRHLWFNGGVTLQGDRSTWRGKLNGTFFLLSGPPGSGEELVTDCYSYRHRFELYHR